MERNDLGPADQPHPPNLSRRVGNLRGAEHKQFNLKRKEKRDLSSDQTMFGRVFTYVMQVLNVPPNVEIFFRTEQPGDLVVANCKEKNQFIPSIVVGQGMLAGRGDKDVAFPSAVFLTKMRPEHYLRAILTSNTELAVALLSAIRLARPDFPVPPQHAQFVEQFAGAMNPFVPFAAREHLGLVVQKYIANKSQLDMAKWAQAVDLSAHRAGLIVCNDLSVAARYIGQESTAVGGMAPKDKVKELVLYSISPTYFELRALLGIAIG